MRKLWAVLKREYLERVRTKWFIVATVFGPILFGAILYLPAYMAEREQASADVARIRILDASGTDVGRNIAAELNGGVLGDTSLTQVVTLSEAELAQAESTATLAVRQRQIKGYLVLPAELSRSGARYAGLNATAIADVRRLESVVSRELTAQALRRAGLSAADAERFKRQRFTLRSERLSTTGGGRGGSGRVNLLFAVGVAMLLYMTILMYGQAVLRGVIEEKQSRVAEIVVSSIRPTTLLSGKVLGVGAVGLTQLAVWLMAGLLMLRYRVPLLQRFGIEAQPLQLPGITPGLLVVLVIFFLLGYTFYSSLFATVGAMVSSEQEAQQAQIPVVMLLVVSVMFLQPVLASPDGKLAVTLGILPMSAPIVMPLRMSAVDVHPWEIFLSLVGLTASCYVAVYFAAYVYRTGLLMYGKRVTVREMVRWAKNKP
jgi:ABC-2 type transport system permease protein